MISFAGPGEYESPAFLGKSKMGMICSKDGRFKPVKSLVPGPGAYAVSVCVCMCVHVPTHWNNYCMYAQFHEFPLLQGTRVHKKLS